MPNHETRIRRHYPEGVPAFGRPAPATIRHEEPKHDPWRGNCVYGVGEGPTRVTFSPHLAWFDGCDCRQCEAARANHGRAKMGLPVLLPLKPDMAGGASRGGDDWPTGY